MRILRPFSAAFLVLATVLAVQGMSVTYASENAPANLRWRKAVIQVAMSESFSESPSIKYGSDVAGALARSIARWEAVTGVNFQTAASDKRNVSPSDSGDGTSLITIAPTAENLLLFAKGPGSISATTRVFFNRRSAITEADIILNPYQQFSTDGTPGTFDLESVFTHEIGHLLGLEHSFLPSSTMYESYGKNGVFGLQNFSARTLAADDIAAARALYGVAGDSEECCGTLAGKLRLSNGNGVDAAGVWLEESSTGRVQAFTVTREDGTYRFSGLPYGTYNILAESGRDARMPFPAQKIAVASVNEDNVPAATHSTISRASDVDLSYIGFNGQLSDLSVPVNAGRTYTIYLGGRGLRASEASVGFTSPYISAVPGTFRLHDYGDQTEAASVEVRIDPATPEGEYSVYLENHSGQRSFIVGGLSVGESPNPFNILTIQRN